ncbi:MAG: tetratricopeptide repeat protein [Flavobacteriales bacterium]|nr:tetratricopeptide repeat protein [Flavobacteriales bacterium]
MGTTFHTHVRIARSLLLGVAVHVVVILSVALVPLAASAGAAATAQECEGLVARSKELLANAPDSALVFALRAEQCMGFLPSAERQATVLIALGDAHLATGDKPAALGVYQRAQLLVEDALEKEGSRPALVLARSDIRMKIGALHFYLRDWDKSIADYNEAMRILDEAPEGIADDELARRKVRLFNNMAGVHIQLQDHGTALPYFEQALVLNRPLKDARNESSLNNNIGICHMEMGRYDLADQYFLKALAVRKEAGDVRGQAQVLNNLGKNQAKVGHFAAARGHYQQALALGRTAGSRESVVITLESLAMVLDTLGEHRTALQTYRAFKALNDSLYSTETRTTIARLEEEFRRDKEKKVLELEAERKDAEAARQRTWNVALVGALFFLLLTAFLLFKVMRARVRNGLLEQEKLRLEREKLEAEQVALRENLESRERELTANALFLLKKNELIAHIAERLLKAKSTFKQENQPIIQEIVRDLQASEDDHNWKEFEVHFTRVHSTFYQTLQERYPSLTPNERKLCAFLRLNMSTKDISAITQQSLNSITVARSRLRKKLQIEGEEVNLVDFLQAI